MTDKIFVTLSLVFALTACGGGGGGDSDEPTSASTQPVSPSTLTSTSTQNETPNNAATGTSGSAPTTPAPSTPTPVTAQSNNLTSTYELTVDVALPQLAGKEAFIVICENKGGDIDYDQCFVKASLRDGVGKFELLLPNHQQSLISEVTPMEAGSNPLTFTWEYDNQRQSTWLIP